MKLTVCHMQGVLDHVTLTASFTQFTFYKVCFPTLALMGLFIVALSRAAGFGTRSAGGGSLGFLYIYSIGISSMLIIDVMNNG